MNKVSARSFLRKIFHTCTNSEYHQASHQEEGAWGRGYTKGNLNCLFLEMWKALFVHTHFSKTKFPELRFVFISIAPCSTHFTSLSIKSLNHSPPPTPWLSSGNKTTYKNNLHHQYCWQVTKSVSLYCRQQKPGQYLQTRLVVHVCEHLVTKLTKRTFTRRLLHCV